MREYEPVVVGGGLLAAWVNGPANAIPRLGVYRYEATGFVPIPFQIDKRRKINLRYNLDRPADGLEYTDVCEFGYFRELFAPAGSTDPFASDQLQAYDEIVFMVVDGGDLVAPASAWPVDPGNPSNTAGTIRYQIAVKDIRTNSSKLFYIFLWDVAPPETSGLSYTQYTQDQNVPPEDPCEPQPESCGMFEGQPAGRFAGVVSYDVHFKKNWVTDGWFVKPDGQTPLADMWNRIEGRVPGETEDSWSSQGNPHVLGIRVGPVRVIRGIQGAQSGHDTAKYEFLYPTMMLSRINLRVHPLAWIWVRVNHESALKNAAYVHTRSDYGAQPARAFDKIDGAYEDGEGQRLGPARFHDWVETLSEQHGAFVRLVSEPRPVATGTRDFFYQENELLGVFGAHGVYWGPTGNMQDGYAHDEEGRLYCDPDLSGPPGPDGRPDPCIPIGNDGGCGAENPESAKYLYARMGFRYFPQGSASLPEDPGKASSAAELGENFRQPLFVIPQKQQKDVTPLPRPTPCAPGLSLQNTTTGSVDVTVATPCDGGGFFVGYLLYRDDGAGGPLGLLRDLRDRTLDTDATTRPGRTYTYALRAYNDAGDLGPLGPSASIAVVDTTPPARPGGIVVSAGSGSGTVTWDPHAARDLYGFNVYLATSPSGPWQKLNVSPRPASEPREWTATGLSGGTYWFHVTAVDQSGNESAPSDAVSFVPEP